MADKRDMEAYLSAVSQANTQSNISFAVARKALDAMKEQGSGTLALIESAAKLQQQASRGVAESLSRLNASIASAGDSGVDVYG